MLQLIEKSTSSCLTLLKRTVLVTKLFKTGEATDGKEQSGLKFENVRPTVSSLTLLLGGKSPK